MYVIYIGAALPQSFDTIIGLTWFAVVVTNGRRSNNAALAAGLFFVLIPQLFATYLPTGWGSAAHAALRGRGGAAGPQPGRDHHDERPSARGPGAEADQRRPAARRKPDAPRRAGLGGSHGIGGCPVSALTHERPAILSGTQVSVNFRGLKALQQVDIRVPEGAITGLVGPNGAGKSTLLGVLSGDVVAQQGTVRLDGKDVSGLTPEARVRTGWPARSSFRSFRRAHRPGAPDPAAAPGSGTVPGVERPAHRPLPATGRR